MPFLKKKKRSKWNLKYFFICSGLFELGLIAKAFFLLFCGCRAFFKWGKKYFILKQITAGSFVLCVLHTSQVSIPLFM